MSQEELRQAAITCLQKAFKGDPVPDAVVQAAVSIVLAPDAGNAGSTTTAISEA